MKGSTLRPAFCVLVVCVLGLTALTSSSPAQSHPAAKQKVVEFKDAVTYSTAGRFATTVAIGDVNGDGKLDLVVGNPCADPYCSVGGIGVLLGNGDGTFQPAVNYFVGTDGFSKISVAIADVNGDGKPDIVTANYVDYPGPESTMSVLLGNGDGTFLPAVVYDSGGTGASGIAVADLNGDGKADIVVVNQCTPDTADCTYYSQPGPGQISVFFGYGDGSFKSPVNYDSSGYFSDAVTIADFNGDGVPDIAVADWCHDFGSCLAYQNDPGGVSVFLGKGDGTFRAPVDYESGGDFAYSIAAGDVNGDGVADLVVANYTLNPRSAFGAIGVMLGNGDGSFQGPASYSYDNVVNALTVAIADVNGDGRTDVILSGRCPYCGTQVQVMPGNGDGSFAAPASFRSGGFTFSYSVAVADLTHDGRPDVVVTSECTRLHGRSCSNDNGVAGVLLNSLYAPTTTAIASSQNPSRVNQRVTITATVSASTAVPDGSTVAFRAGKAVLGQATTKNGVASLTTSFSKAKTYTVKAQYGGDAFHGNSSGTVKQVVTP